MRYLRLLAPATAILMLAAHVEAQTTESVSEVVVAPFVVSPGNSDALRAVLDGCADELVAALKHEGVTVRRDSQLSEKNLRSAPALWAVLGRLSSEESQFRLELQLLEVKSGEEMRSYLNQDKDPKVACRVVSKAAERIAAFVKEHKASQPNP